MPCFVKANSGQPYLEMWKRQSSGIHRTIIGLPCNTQLHMLFLVQLSTQLLTSCVLWIGRTREPKTHRACSKKSLVDFAQCFGHIYRTRYMPDERRFVKALAISKPNRVQKMTLSLSRVQKKNTDSWPVCTAVHSRTSDKHGPEMHAPLVKRTGSKQAYFKNKIKSSVFQVQKRFK